MENYPRIHITREKVFVIAGAQGDNSVFDGKPEFDTVRSETYSSIPAIEERAFCIKV